MKVFLIVALLLGVACVHSQTYQNDKPDRKQLFRRRLPFAGNGTCEEPVTTANGETTVRCLGPEIPMLPGQTLDAYILLESPYPKDKNVTVLRQVAQMVARTGKNSWREVPLTELYFHHVVPNPRFLLGEGAEVRGSRLRKPLPHPHAFMVDGAQAAEHKTRMTNIQLVNTIGVLPKDMQKSIECWCGHDQLGEESTKGSLFCCKQSSTNSSAGVENYQLEYNITFRDVAKEEKRVDFFGYDASDNRLEYNIVEPLGPNTNHTVALETTIDKDCPQKEPFEIVRCTAHQHVGSVCMHAYDLDANKLICSSCPLYGKEKDVPGNELGYVVAIEDGDPAYKIKPGTRIRVESIYSGAQKRLGVMGILAMWVSELKDNCGRFSTRTPMSMMGEAHMDADVSAA